MGKVNKFLLFISVFMDFGFRFNFSPRKCNFIHSHCFQAETGFGSTRKKREKSCLQRFLFGTLASQPCYCN